MPPDNTADLPFLHNYHQNDTQHYLKRNSYVTNICESNPMLPNMKHTQNRMPVRKYTPTYP